MNKGEALAALQAEYARLEAALAWLTEEQMIAPLLRGGVSVKDMLVHLRTWDERGTAWIAAAAQGEDPAIPLPGHTWKDLPALNAQTYAANRDRPLTAVLAEYRGAFARLLAQVEALTDADWTRPYRRRPVADPPPLAHLVEWRVNHLQDHSAPIHKLVAKVRKAATPRG